MTKLPYVVLIAAFCAPSVVAADKAVNRPRVYSDIVACRNLPDSARLACYDAAAQALEGATEKRQVVMLDQVEVRKTKRSLFGFSLPKIPFFGESDEEQDEEFKQVECALAGIQAVGNGKYQFTVQDAGTWQTTETSWSMLKNGQKFKIKRGAVGSYMLVVNNQGIRVKRVN
jgi:hypothetical protein